MPGRDNDIRRNPLNWTLSQTRQNRIKSNWQQEVIFPNCHWPAVRSPIVQWLPTRLSPEFELP